MAKTAVVNPKRKKKKKSTSSGQSRPRRRKPRVYGSAATTTRRRRRGKRRRRNPTSMSPYNASGGYRRKNPNLNFDEIMSTLPAATGGVWAARWAVRQAGAFEIDKKTGNPVPGFKHAIAVVIAAHFGSQVIGQLLGGSKEAEIAKIAAYGYAGDLFARLRFMQGNEWVNQNISLQGDTEYMAGSSSALGADSFVDAVGNKYIRTEGGWALAGLGQGEEQGAVVQGPDGELYQVVEEEEEEEDEEVYAPAMAGRYAPPMAMSTGLGMTRVRPSANNSFGYA